MWETPTALVGDHMVKVEQVPDGIVLLSVHEVTPAFEDDVVRSCDMLDELGFHQYTLLVTPFYGLKRANTFEKHDSFTEYLLSIEKELALHGYSHFSKSGAFDEFRRLPSEKLELRLNSSIRMFTRVFRSRPRGIVPPAWVAPQKLVQLSRNLGLSYCVIGNRVYSTKSRQTFETTDQIVSRGTQKVTLGTTLVELELGGSVQIALHPSDYRRNDMFDLLVDLRDRLGYRFMSYWDFLSSIYTT